MEISLKSGFSIETGGIFRADADPDLINATTSISNRYDDSGSRVEKSLEAGAKFTYISDLNGQTLAVLDENGTELFYNIYGLDLIGQYDVEAAEEYYHLKDHLGNIRVTIDDKWNVLAYNGYYPFSLQLKGQIAQNDWGAVALVGRVEFISNFDPKFTFYMAVSIPANIYALDITVGATFFDTELNGYQEAFQ